MSTINYNLLLTRGEAADFLGVPVSTIRSLSDRGQLGFFKFGRRYRYSIEDLKKFPVRVEPRRAPETAHFFAEMSGGLAHGGTGTD